MFTSYMQTLSSLVHRGQRLSAVYTLQHCSHCVVKLKALLAVRDCVAAEKTVVRVFGVVVFLVFAESSAEAVMSVFKLGGGVAVFNTGVCVEVEEEAGGALETGVSLPHDAVVGRVADCSVHVEGRVGVCLCQSVDPVEPVVRLELWMADCTGGILDIESCGVLGNEQFALLTMFNVTRNTLRTYSIQHKSFLACQTNIFIWIHLFTILNHWESADFKRKYSMRIVNELFAHRA